MKRLVSASPYYPGGTGIFKKWRNKMTVKFRSKRHFRGPVTIGTNGDPVDFTINGATSGSHVVYDASVDLLTVTADTPATDTPLVVAGWTNLGYGTTNPSGATTAGGVKLISVNSKFFLALAVGSSSYRFIELSGTSTA